MNRNISSTTGATGSQSGPKVQLTNTIYRPENAIPVRNGQEFKHPYETLYPVHSIATFEAPIEWKLAAEGNPTSFSSSRALTFDVTATGTTAFAPRAISVSSKDLVESTTSATKKTKNGLCGCSN